MILVVYEKIILDAKAKKYYVELLSAKASRSSGAHKLRAYVDSAAATVDSTENIGQEAADVANTRDILYNNY